MWRSYRTSQSRRKLNAVLPFFMFMIFFDIYIITLLFSTFILTVGLEIYNIIHEENILQALLTGLKERIRVSHIFFCFLPQNSVTCEMI